MSSTKDDLLDHRREVRDTLDRLGCRVLWMEGFGARPMEPVRACLAEVERADLVVGIYAHRYGFIPASTEVSVTELEYVRAIELGRPVFAFIVDDDFEWRTSFVDRGSAYDRLEALKQRIRTESVVDRFTTPVDLAYRVVMSIGPYVSNEEAADRPRRGVPAGLAGYINLANIALTHTSFRYPKADARFNDGRKYYGIHVIVMAPNPVLDRIRKVTYRLDEGYPEEYRTQVITDRTSRFKMKELSSGPSIVTATIETEDLDEPIELNRFIDLREEGPRL